MKKYGADKNEFVEQVFKNSDKEGDRKRKDHQDRNTTYQNNYKNL